MLSPKLHRPRATPPGGCALPEKNTLPTPFPHSRGGPSNAIDADVPGPCWPPGPGARPCPTGKVLRHAISKRRMLYCTRWTPSESPLPSPFDPFGPGRNSLWRGTCGGNRSASAVLVSHSRLTIRTVAQANRSRLPGSTPGVSWFFRQKRSASEDADVQSHAEKRLMAFAFHTKVTSPPAPSPPKSASTREG